MLNAPHARAVRMTVVALALSTAAACADRGNPTAPVAPSPSLSAAPWSLDPNASLTVKMRDLCDPVTFNAVLGPGTCVGDGNVTFNAFIAELTATQNVVTWRNNPAALTVPVGTTLDIINRGGEVHTFTHVARFGGGIVPTLNELAEVGRAVPECKNLLPSDFVPPGGGFSIPTGGTGPGVGTHLYMCCIHPWMKTTAVVQ